MNAKLQTACWIIRYFGFKWIAYRIWRRLLLVSGYYALRYPSAQWSGSGTAQRDYFSGRFFFHAQDICQWRAVLQELDLKNDEKMEEADAVLEGSFRYYGWRDVFRGESPDWFLDPFSGKRAAQSVHWSRGKVGDFDIKDVWELSRFSWVFSLVRAYAREAQAIWPETFWRLFDEWTAANRPNTGANWSCGQESSLRLVPWLFALHAFDGHPSTTPERRRRMLEAIEVSGQRIEQDLPYALSQRNNHGLSEAMGLLIAGLFGDAATSGRRIKQAVSLLETQCSELFYADGAFCQHSSNYHRLAIHVLVVSVRLMQVNHLEVPAAVRAALKQSGRFLDAVVEPASGDAPNCGGNDGAWLLQLNTSAYIDYRPTLSLIDRVLGESGPISEFPEQDLWLGLDASNGSSDCQKEADALCHKHIFQSKDWRVLVNTPDYAHRPAHADLLHVDLWFRGCRVAIDAGSYSYNAPPPFENGLRETRYHNTVEVARRSQMQPVGRFMLLPWQSAHCLQSGSCKGFQWSLFSHAAYEDLADPVAHRRLVAVGESWVVIIDRIESQTEHSSQLHWLLEDHPLSIQSSSEPNRMTSQLALADVELYLTVASLGEATTRVERAGTDSADGWQSRRYGELTPAHAIFSKVTAPRNCWVTVFSSSAAKVTIAEDRTLVALNDGAVKLEVDTATLKVAEL